MSATPLAVGSLSSVNLPHGAELLVDFAVWNYGYHNPGYSPYPTEIGLQIVAPAVQPLPQYLFQGWIESIDGSASSPLVVQVGPGTVFWGDGRLADVAVLNAYALMSQSESAALFGERVRGREESARIRLRNLGDAFEIGLGPGYTVRQAVSLPGVSGDGPARTSGYVSGVYIDTPEPSSALLMLAAILILLLCRRGATPSRS